jgi:CheY-like chemotaxis protein
MKFLIVDDSRAVQTIIRRALERTGVEGLEFKTANDGEQAMELVPQWQPDLIITDWHMPTMSGIELLQLLRQTGFGHVKVGFVTTETSARNLEEAKKNGALFVINKPCTDDELQNAVYSVFPQMRPRTKKEAPAAAPVAKTVGVCSPSNLLQHLQNELKLSVTLTSVLRKPMAELNGPLIVGIYKAQDTANIAGVSLLDKKAALLIGGTLSGWSVKDCLARINDENLHTSIAEQAVSFLTRGADHFFDGNVAGKLVMSASNVVKRPSEKLSTVIESSATRYDYLISQSEFGNGLISLIST